MIASCINKFPAEDFSFCRESVLLIFGCFVSIPAQCIERYAEGIGELDCSLDRAGITADSFLNGAFGQTSSIGELLNGQALFLAALLNVHSDSSFQERADQKDNKCNQTNQLHRFDDEFKNFLLHLDKLNILWYTVEEGAKAPTS